MSDAKHDKELDFRIGKAIAIKRALDYSVAVRRELSKKAKLSIFETVFVVSHLLYLCMVVKVP